MWEKKFFSLRIMMKRKEKEEDEAHILESF